MQNLESLFIFLFQFLGTGGDPFFRAVIFILRELQSSVLLFLQHNQWPMMRVPGREQN